MKIFSTLLILSFLLISLHPSTSEAQTSDKKLKPEPKKEKQVFSVPFPKKGIIFDFTGIYTGQIGENTDDTKPGYGGSLSLLYAFHPYFAAGVNMAFSLLSKGSEDFEMSVQLYSFSGEFHAYMDLTESLKGYIFFQAGYVREVYSTQDTTGIENGLNLGVGVGIKKAVAKNVFVGITGGYQAPLWAEECYTLPFGTGETRCTSPTQKTWYAGVNITYVFPYEF